MTNMTTHDKVLERYEDIIKSENDDRLYRGLVLNNKMKVLLISDPTTDKSAAALNVNIGSMCDPDDLPGLAHFCEHMLVLGTKKYPERNDYKKYISESAGNLNALTKYDDTTYYFDVNPTKLMGALDRFAQLFIAPLFTESLTSLEVNAIHSEYMINLASDGWRLKQLIKSSANPRHPYSKFDLGNRETLDVLPKQMGINVRQRLIEFYEKYYSANVMSLCVLGAETLDELEKMVINLFSQVRNKEIEIPICYKLPFVDKHFRTKWYIVSVNDTSTLRVAFPIPDLQEYYQSKSLHYVSHLLHHEGSGSLLFTLKKMGWCCSIKCEKQPNTRGFDIIRVDMNLTAEGIKHVDNIITLMFQYINMLKEHGPVEWIYNEYRDLAEVQFRFTEKQQPLSYVISRVVELRKSPMKEILCEEFLFPQWKPELVYNIMKCFTPMNIRIHVVAKEYESVANETERWFGTKYKKEKIPTEIIDMWENAGYNPEFHLPAKNKFIPSKLDLKPRDDNVKKFPTIIADTPFVRLWFKQDDEYLVPKAKMCIRFVSPYTQIDAVSYLLASMHINLLAHRFSQFIYPASLAGLFWSFLSTLEGITLNIYGYDDKQYMLLENIMDSMLNFTINPRNLEEMKKTFISKLENAVFELFFDFNDHIHELLCESVFTRVDLIQSASYVTLDKFQEFIPQLFSRVHVECLIYGNMIEKEALKIARMIESKLKSAMHDIIPLEQRQLLLRREINLGNGHHFLMQMKTTLRTSSNTTVYYQIGMQSTVTNMLLELIVSIINEPCYDILRTQEQLGYAVHVNERKLNVTQGLTVTVRSEKHPRYVEQRIDLFLNSMVDYISTMSQEKFEEHKNSIVTSLVKNSRNLFLKADMFWNEITQQLYNWDRANIDTAYLKTVTQEQLLNYFKENILGPARRKLSLHVIPTLMDIDESEEEKNEFDDMLARGEIIEIADILSFKRSQTLCPALEPCVKFPKRDICSSNM